MDCIGKIRFLVDESVLGRYDRSCESDLIHVVSSMRQRRETNDSLIESLVLLEGEH